MRLLSFLLFAFAVPAIAFELWAAPAKFQLWPIVLQLALAFVFYVMSSSRFRAHLWLNLASRSPFFAAHSLAVGPRVLIVR